MIRFVFTPFCSLLLLSLASTSLKAQKLHDPSEIFQLISDSRLKYLIEQDDDIQGVPFETPQLTPGMGLIKTPSGADSLGILELRDEAIPHWEKAEEAFAAKNFAEAITWYRKLLKIQPEYHSAYTMIGDAHFNMGQYDSARFYLEFAIEENYVDYQAHWFLASTLKKLGDDEEALHQITIAHILNPGHTILKQVLNANRKRLDRTWKEWSFAPAYELVEEMEDEVRVRFASGWMMYSLAKALWAYEPGYVETMGLTEDDVSLSALPEKEALLSFIIEQSLARNAVEEGEKDESALPAREVLEMADRLAEIFEADMVELFIYYEIIGKQYPRIFSAMSPETIEHFVQYVNRYH